MPTIEVRGLSKWFAAGEAPHSDWRFWLAGRRACGQIPALREIDFAVEAGELVGVVGANGAGKTTLLRVLATLLLPDAGEVTIGGLDVVEHAAEVRRRIGLMLPEDAGFAPRLSLRSNLEFYGALSGRYVGRPDIYYALDAVGLAERADELYAGLGTGHRRRLSLARALLGDPRILLLDEPARSVDSEFAERIADVVRHAAHSRGAAVLLVSHDRDEIRNLCDRSLLLHEGRLLHATTVRKPAAAAPSAVGG